MKIQKCITCDFPLGKKRTREGMYVSDSKLLLDSKYLLIILLGWHAVKNINTLKKNPIISYCVNKRRSALKVFANKLFAHSVTMWTTTQIHSPC